MSEFFEDAVRVFETATQGSGAAEFGILLDDAGALRIVMTEGWRPEALQAHYGARTVFQVTRTPSAVRVIGRSAHSSCALQSESPRAGVAALDGSPLYAVAPSLALKTTI